MSAFFATIAHFLPVAWNAVITYAPVAIAVAAAGAAALPKGTPGTPWFVARQVLDVIALNFGNAKNAPVTPPPTPPAA